MNSEFETDMKQAVKPSKQTAILPSTYSSSALKLSTTHPQREITSHASKQHSWMNGFKVILPVYIIKGTKEVEQKFYSQQLRSLPINWGINNNYPQSNYHYQKVITKVKVFDDKISLVCREGFSISKKQLVMIYLSSIGRVKLELAHQYKSKLKLDKSIVSTPGIIKVFIPDDSSDNIVAFSQKEHFLDLLTVKDEESKMEFKKQIDTSVLPPLLDLSVKLPVTQPSMKVESKIQELIKQEMGSLILECLHAKEDSKSKPQELEEESKSSHDKSQAIDFNPGVPFSVSSFEEKQLKATVQLVKGDLKKSSSTSSKMVKQSSIKTAMMKGCSCKVIQCITKQCGCKKVGNKCNPYCRCLNCMNRS